MIAAYVLEVTANMDTKTIRVYLPADDDGYTGFQCPFCGYEFRLSNQDLASDIGVSTLFCPSCGLESEPMSLLADGARRCINAEVANAGREILNDWMDEMERKFRGSKYVKLEKGKPFRLEQPRPIPERTDLDIVTLPCCGRTAKVSSLEATTGVYCPYCGVK